MHIFSMTCKAESMLDRLGDADERRTAIRWFREHGVTKLYLESYRHGRLVPAERLALVRDDFRRAGLEVGGCITPTSLSERNNFDLVGCYTDPAALARLQAIVETTARLFDFFILDDFLFTDCQCESCRRERGGLSWAQARCACMREIGRRHILEPARAANPRVRVILKYPLWYEIFRERGYDVPAQNADYDEVWIGTETRDPDSRAAGRRPQTAASWIQGWMNDLAGEKSGGGWYDPIDTSPATYVEQARQTILGGARESLLHCYDYLATDTPGVAVHGRDVEVRHGRADAAAFLNELSGLKKLAACVENLAPRGVLVPKNPGQNSPDHGEPYLPGFVGMLGIPVLAAGALRQAPAAFLGMQAAGFDGLAGYIAEACAAGRPLVVTEALRDALLAAGETLPDALATATFDGEIDGHRADLLHLGETLSLLRCPADLWDLCALPDEALHELRRRLCRPFGLELTAPARVSLHLFGNGDRAVEAVENFNDHPVELRLRLADPQAAPQTLTLALPDANAAELRREDDGTCALRLAPRSLALLSTTPATPGTPADAVAPRS